MPQAQISKDDAVKKLEEKSDMLMAEVKRLQKEGRLIKAELRELKDKEDAVGLLHNIIE
ncbi:hypothetical protein KKA13_01695 [Patescibacteria group bacterium]|nr:hypothetical protein [Patescibacteria group bacterium]MBU1613260.1 hypothetical protein [Patescibacteria group bacterium]